MLTYYLYTKSQNSLLMSVFITLHAVMAVMFKMAHLSLNHVVYYCVEVCSFGDVNDFSASD